MSLRSPRLNPPGGPLEARCDTSEREFQRTAFPYRQIRLIVTGAEIREDDLDNPLVCYGEKLYLLPVRGSDTQWYRNVLQNPSIRIDARGTEAEFRATPISEAKTVKSVIEKFREKYGAKDVKKYYSTFDVAVLVELVQSTILDLSRATNLKAYAVQIS